MGGKADIRLTRKTRFHPLQGEAGSTGFPLKYATTQTGIAEPTFATPRRSAIRVAAPLGRHAIGFHDLQ